MLELLLILIVFFFLLPVIIAIIGYGLLVVLWFIQLIALIIDVTLTVSYKILVYFFSSVTTRNTVK